ncbi:autotransporter domain-containing protein [Microvirga sp. WGZ8]|uniref:Autotransporter domain-containing protein n=1 Tax=Microvirga puerhi TaxID=2876078 RepID=A0ABS7VQE4_9HYPH|nr:autotransporter domain-containing protein [Microvirga puerhi]
MNTKGYDSVWSNDIVGTGGLIKRGDGNLVLTGANTYEGGTNVLGGILTLNGSVASAMEIGSSATLRGTGVIQAPLTLAGTLEPGAAAGGSFGTLTVTGNATLLPTSTYRVDANAQGQHDRLVVGGTTTLSGGALEVVLVNGRAPVDTAMEIISSEGGATGLFGTVRSNSVSAFLDPRLHYSGNSVTVSFERNDTSFASTESNPDAKDVAASIEALGPHNRLVEAILALDAASADQAIDLLSGEAHASAVAAAYGDSRLVQDALLNRLRAPLVSRPTTQVPAAYAADKPGRPAPVASVPYPSLDQRRFALWGEGFGSWGRIGSTASTAGLESSTGGFILGADARLTDGIRLGLAGGYTRTSFDVDSLLSSGSNESVFGALYGSATWGAFTLRLGASYAGHDIDTQRTITFPGFADATSASYNGSTLQAFGEAGYRFAFAGAEIEPFLGASVLRLHTDNFVESGGAAALVGYARTYNLGTTTLGVRAEARLSEEVPLIFKGLIGWRHAFGDVEPEALLAFRDGASAFTVSGTPLDKNALIAEAGLEWQPSEAITLGVSYSGQIGHRAQEHTVKGNFVWKFETR